MVKPLAIDLCCGLGGFTEGLLAVGFDVIGFDIERHVYGEHRYPARLVIQDVLTLHGSQFRDAALIVASPPCQFFSYTAMPWRRAKELAAVVKSNPDRMEKELALFNACFRIQREACAAAGRHVPLIVENVKGAQPWVGRARWNFGSFYLWGDTPALMPSTRAYKSSGMNWCDQTKRGQDFTRIAGKQAMTTADLRRAAGMDDGIKQGGTWFHDNHSISRMSSSKSPQRKAASAMIAKIPLPLSRHIAATFYPRG